MIHQHLIMIWEKKTFNKNRRDWSPEAMANPTWNWLIGIYWGSPSGSSSMTRIRIVAIFFVNIVAHSVLSSKKTSETPAHWVSWDHPRPQLSQWEWCRRPAGTPWLSCNRSAPWLRSWWWWWWWWWSKDSVTSTSTGGESLTSEMITLRYKTENSWAY